MTFAERIQSIIDEGVAAWRDLANKASQKAKDIGAMGALKLEIVQLQSHAGKLIAKLGNEVYTTLVDKSHATISSDTPSIRDIIKEIEGLRERIELKEREYKSIGGKEES